MVQPVIHAISAFLAIFNSLPIPLLGLFGLSLFYYVVLIIVKRVANK